MNLSENPQKQQNNDDDLKARMVAFEMMSDILDRKNALDVVLDRHKVFAGLDARDRGFTRMLLTTTLRRLGQIDDLINSCLDKGNVIKSKEVAHVLRLGVTQVFFMDVQDHASVDTSVRLVEKLGFDKQKGFVNAILRRLIREGTGRIEKQDAGRLNTPEWLLKIWIDDYGMKTAGAIAAANMSEAALDLTVKQAGDFEYYHKLFKARDLGTGSLRITQGGNVRELDGFEEGRWWVQDFSAALPVKLLGDVAGQHVVDMCAAPGGKTLQLAAKGAVVTAVDRSAKRMKRLDENIERMGFDDNVRVEIADASVWKPLESPHYILLDAPCSATGTMRRHPDTGYLKSPEDIEGLCGIQKRILDHAAQIIAVDGVIIYCTCSLQKAEGEHQIEAFLAANPNFERVAVSVDEIGGYAELINAQGDVRVLPSMMAEQGGADGFFISRLKRSS